MKTLLFLLLSTCAFSQNLIIKKGEVITINSDYQNITFNGRGKLIINGNVNVQNLNINGNGHITINYGGVLNLSSSLNLNGDTLVNNGTLKTSAIEVQGNGGYLQNNALINIEGDLQINHHTGVVRNCDKINIKQSFNINSGKYIACACSSITSYNLNHNGVIEGKGSLYFKQINLNTIFTTSEDIYVYYTGTINQNLWGSANLNYVHGCNTSLPVKLSMFKAFQEKEGIRVNMMFSDLDGMSEVRIKTSKDGKTWTIRKIISREEISINKNLTYLIK